MKLPPENARAQSTPPAIMRTPRSLDIELTARCNLHCRYCYFFENPQVVYADLPTREWQTFFEECGRCAVISVSLAGGEPFLREDLPQLLDAIVRNRMRFSLLSNGMLIDDDIAAYIAGTGRCDCVQISIDGADETTHDACRGQGSFVGAIQGIKVLQRHNVPVTVRVTIHRRNVEHLEAIAHLLLDELGLPGFSTNAAGYLGACRQNASHVLLRPQERQLAMETLLRLSEKYHHRITANAGPLAEARYWMQMEAARLQCAPAFSHGGHLTACGCSMQKIAVRADGVIVPCSMLPHIELGRINQDSLAGVWQRSAELNQLRQRQTIPLTQFEFCAECAYLPYCTGNCPALAYSLTRQLDHPSPDACLRRFLEDGGKIPTVEGM
jgi:SynChlorMet cassette radical SAM/SPASM protein ScmE